MGTCHAWMLEYLPLECRELSGSARAPAVSSLLTDRFLGAGRRQ